MAPRILSLLFIGAAALVPAFAANFPTASCASQPQPSGGIKPSVASGYTWAVVATGLTQPRSLQVDNDDNLWVLESGKGLSKHTLKDNGGVCVSVDQSTDVIDDVMLNHGLVVDGSQIFVSSAEQLYVVQMDDQSKIMANTNKTLVMGMSGTDHTTRTLLKVSGAGNSILVSRGSVENIDPAAGNKASGHSTVKMFDLSNITDGQPYQYNNSGTLLGWGLRNDVGLAQHPTTGGIFTVENSVDQLMRDGQDIHQDNPGEEMNFLGFMDGNKTSNLGANFGYPSCYTAWTPSDLPNNGNLTVGSPFSPQSSNDSDCAKTVAPRLTFQAHMAPLDMKFNNSATEAWISFHGSWDRNDPVGYSVAMVSFNSGGMPTEPPNSTKAANFIFANADNSKCPDSCFRPAGMAFDSKGRLYIASDASGEVYVVAKDATSNGTSNGTSGGSGSSSESTRRVSGSTIAVVTAICIIAALI